MSDNEERTDSVRKVYLEIVQADDTIASESIKNDYLADIENLFRHLNMPRNIFYNLKASAFLVAVNGVLAEYIDMKPGERLVRIDNILKFFNWCEKDNKIKSSELLVVIPEVVKIKNEIIEEFQSKKDSKKYNKLCSFYSDFCKVKKNGGNKETQFFDFLLENKSIKNIDKAYFGEDRFLRNIEEFCKFVEDLDAVDDLLRFLEWCSKDKDIRVSNSSLKNLEMAKDELTYIKEKDKYLQFANESRQKLKAVQSDDFFNVQGVQKKYIEPIGVNYFFKILVFFGKVAQFNDNLLTDPSFLDYVKKFCNFVSFYCVFSDSTRKSYLNSVSALLKECKTRLGKKFKTEIMDKAMHYLNTFVIHKKLDKMSQSQAGEENNTNEFASQMDMKRSTIDQKPFIGKYSQPSKFSQNNLSMSQTQPIMIDLIEEKKEFKMKTEELEKENKNLKFEKDVVNTNLQEIKTQRENLEKQNKKYKKANEQFIVENANMKSKISEQERLLQKYKQKLEKLKEKYEDVKEDKRDLEDEVMNWKSYTNQLINYMNVQSQMNPQQQQSSQQQQMMAQYLNFFQQQQQQQQMKQESPNNNNTNNNLNNTSSNNLNNSNNTSSSNIPNTTVNTTENNEATTAPIFPVVVTKAEIITENVPQTSNNTNNLNNVNTNAPTVSPTVVVPNLNNTNNNPNMNNTIPNNNTNNTNNMNNFVHPSAPRVSAISPFNFFPFSPPNTSFPPFPNNPLFSNSSFSNPFNTTFPSPFDTREKKRKRKQKKSSKNKKQKDSESELSDEIIDQPVSTNPSLPPDNPISPIAVTQHTSDFLNNTPSVDFSVNNAPQVLFSQNPIIKKEGETTPVDKKPNIIPKQIFFDLTNDD